jgi:hypothetical protein
MSKKMKVYEIEVPVDGQVHIYKTDLICNSCGRQLGDGEYLYFCMKDKDDLCSNYNCLKKHAGHRFFRWGRVELGVKTEGPQINTASRIGPPSAASKLVTILSPTIPSRPPAPPCAPSPIKTTIAPGGPPSLPMAPPAPPADGPVIKAGLPAFTALRDDMLMELKRLKTIVKGE